MGIFNNTKKLFEKNAESIAKDAGKIAAELADEVVQATSNLEKKVDQTVKKVEKKASVFDLASKAIAGAKDVNRTIELIANINKKETLTLKEKEILLKMKI